MADILGPASDQAVTVRPARSISRGAHDTWFKDCTDPDSGDGTAFSADFFNDSLAQLRTALRSSGIVLDGADDMLWRAVQSIGLRYAVDSGSENTIVVDPQPPVADYYPGLALLIKLSNSVTGATTIAASGLNSKQLRWPDATPLVNGDATAGAVLLVVYDGTRFQLLCQMNNTAPSAQFVPGVVYLWPLETPPAGTLECNGQNVSRTTYARLFGIIGTAYGAGNGTTTFKLPNYCGEFLRGWDHGKGNDPNAATRTSRGDGTSGDHVGTKQAGAAGHIELSGAAAILHAENVPQVTGTSLTSGSDVANIPVLSDAAKDLTGTIDIVGDSGAETRPRNVNIMYVIAY